MKRYQQNYYLYNRFLESVGICKPEQLKAYLTNIGIPENVQHSLIKTSLVQRNASFDGQYFYSNQSVSYTQFSTSLEKSIWYFVNKCTQFDFFNFHPKLPASAYFLDNNANKKDDLTVFYIPKGTEGITTRIIETNYGGLQSIINTALIVDDLQQREHIVLTEIFNVKDIVTVSQDGKIVSLE